MVLEILKDSPLLNERSIEWNVSENSDMAIELVQNLNDTLKENPDRSYLCANEIGYPNRAFILRFSDESRVFMNPIFQHRDNLRLVREYDPLTKKQFIIPRFTDVTICFQNSIGKIEAIKFNEIASPIVSQAMDCIEGVHSSDYGLEISPDFDQASPEEQQTVLNAYLQSLQEFMASLDKDLSSDQETKKEWDSLKFMRAKINGEIQEDNSPKLNRKQKRWFEKLVKKLKRRKK